LDRFAIFLRDAVESPPVTGSIGYDVRGLDAGEGFELADEPWDAGPPPLPAGDEPSRPFSAFPHLHAPDRVAPGERFDVTVGFRNDPDPDLSEVQAISLEAQKIRPGSRCQILLLGDGVRLERTLVEVPLEVGAAVLVGAWVERGAARARVRAQYVYDRELVGTATREIGIAGGVPLETPPNPCRIKTEIAAPPDLTATAMYGADGTLRWTLFAKAIDYQTLEPLTINLGRANPREFATDLMRDVRTSLGKVYWPNTIRSLGVDVSQAVPPEFFVAIRLLGARLGRTPSVLLVTEETYVPWELAWMDPPLDPGAPNHLGCQVNFGRWVDEANVVLPPASDVPIRDLYAVADGTLPHAQEEQDGLRTEYGAVPLPATLAGIEPILVESEERRRGIHFALHGESNPAANEQALLLADGEDLPARALGRPHRCGEEAVCGFVYLSACQVGVVGASLGVTGGFPGVMMRSGSDGVVGPFWDVDDGVAKRLALEFYRHTLNEGTTVGEAMRKLRLSAGSGAEADPRGETRLAYVYYGHPNTRIERR
jgi:hypothetical protein